MRILLKPLSFLYGCVVRFRNLLFDSGVLKQRSFNSMVINVGNLSAGGTGKSPHVLYLIELLRNKYKVAVLSRGYGRSTKGFRWVNKDSSAIQVGDEPLQYANLFPDIDVAVCESRVEGIKRIEQEKIIEIILLDDAFQHRYVKPDINILISDYKHLFYNDSLLPLGMLREPASEASRADIVVVSKTREDMSPAEMSIIAHQVSRYGINKTLFSYMHYRKTMEFSNGEKMPIDYMHNCHVIIVAGIAKPQPFIEFVKENAISTIEFLFNDHHQFASGEIIKIKECYQGLVARNNGPVLVVTTRKDWMRLNSAELKHLHQSLPLAVIDIEVYFHQDGSKVLNELIEESIKQKRC